MTQNWFGSGGSEGGQLLVWEKSPLVAIWLMTKVSSPWFDRMTWRTALKVPHARFPKFHVVGVNVAFGLVAVPASGRIEAMPWEPCTVSDPDFAPPDDGANETLMVHVPDVGRVGETGIVTTRGKARPSRRLERRLYQCSPERAKVHPPTRRPLTVVAGSIVTGAVIGAADPPVHHHALGYLAGLATAQPSVVSPTSPPADRRSCCEDWVASLARVASGSSEAARSGQISQTKAAPARPHQNGRLGGRSPGMIHEKTHRSSHPTVRESLRSGPAPRQTSVDSMSEDLSSSLRHSCGMHQAFSPLRVYFVGHYMALSAPGAVGQGRGPSSGKLEGRR